MMIRNLMQSTAPKSLKDMGVIINATCVLIRADVMRGSRDDALTELANLRRQLDEARSLAREIESEIEGQEAPPF